MPHFPSAGYDGVQKDGGTVEADSLLPEEQYGGQEDLQGEGRFKNITYHQVRQGNICCRLIWVPCRQLRQRPFLSLRSSLCVADACLPTLPSRGAWG